MFVYLKRCVRYLKSIKHIEAILVAQDKMLKLQDEIIKAQAQTLERQDKIRESEDKLAEKLCHLKASVDNIQKENSVNYAACMRQLYSMEGKWQLDVMTRASGMEYFRTGYVMKVKDLFDIHSLEEEQYCLTRYGNDSDGGYIMVNDLEQYKIAYSFGINDDVSWDRDMATYGIDVYMYDHTIDWLPEENEHFHWKKTGIIGEHDANIKDLKTLDTLLEENGHQHENNMLLKIDVEGAEWSVFEHTSQDTLKKFSQIVIEFHDMNNISNAEHIINALQNLNKTHCPVHVHGNNYRSYSMLDGVVLPDVLECVFLNRNKYKLRKCEQFFPNQLDKANYSERPDIILGIWGNIK